jgi:mannose-6-phosphate isomerase-like protein (cupin superfamily)
MAEYTLEPGGEPGTPHFHARHSDTFYVLEGELEFVIDGKAVRAPAGTVLAAPRGAIHAFPVAIGGRARFLNLHTPGGFERYIRELTAMRSRGEKPTDEFFRSHDQYNV